MSVNCLAIPLEAKGADTSTCNNKRDNKIHLDFVQFFNNEILYNTHTRDLTSSINTYS